MPYAYLFQTPNSVSVQHVTIESASTVHQLILIRVISLSGVAEFGLPSLIGWVNEWEWMCLVLGKDNQFIISIRDGIYLNREQVKGEAGVKFVCITKWLKIENLNWINDEIDKT